MADDPRDEPLAWKVHARVDKYNGPDADARALAGDEPDEVTESDGNLLTTAGLDKLTKCITVASTTPVYDNTNSRIGVGNSATAALIGDVDLNAAAGSANRQFETMQATFPTQVNGVMTFKVIFTTGEANFVWNEWGIDNGSTVTTTVVAPLLNHKVTALGTKTSASAWTFTVTITLS